MPTLNGEGVGLITLPEHGTIDGHLLPFEVECELLPDVLSKVHLREGLN
jgi:hypothetical protein